MIRIVRSFVVIALAVVCSAALLYFAPGANVDESELVGQFSNESVQQIRAERARRHDLPSFLARYVRQIVGGDQLTSELYGERIGPILRERSLTTAVSVSKGLFLAWLAAIAVAIWVCFYEGAITVGTSTTATAILLSVPSAVLAVLCLVAQLPAHVAIAAAVFPRVFPVAEEELRTAKVSPHAVFGRAKGLPASRVFFAHMIPGTLPALFALAGVSIIFAIGVSIPVEALLDFPGVGQLAWKAALGRDLPVLVTITVLITTATVAINLCIDLALLALRLKTV